MMNHVNSYMLSFSFYLVFELGYSNKKEPNLNSLEFLLFSEAVDNYTKEKKTYLNILYFHRMCIYN